MRYNFPEPRMNPCNTCGRIAIRYFRKVNGERVGLMICSGCSRPTNECLCKKFK